MAKKNMKQNSDPIEFELPKWGTKGSRVPNPINKSNWDYGYDEDKDSKSQNPIGFFSVIMLAAAVILAYMLISTSIYKFFPWFVVAAFTAFGILTFNIDTFKKQISLKRNSKDKMSNKKSSN